MRIGWSTDFVVVDAEQCADDELRRVRESLAEWVVVEREGGRWRYVFGREELLDLPRLSWLLGQGVDLRSIPLKDALNLHETMASTQASDAADVTPLPPNPAQPSAARFVEMENGVPTAVGGADVVRRPTTRSMRPVRLARSIAATPAELPASSPEEPAVGLATADDEGSTPLRFPSIEPEGELRSGAPLTLVVDLLREESATTFGGTVFPPQEADWESFDVDVSLQSPDIDFDGGGYGTLTVRRNAATLCLRVTGLLHAGLVSGSEIEVKARFLVGTRFCGSAARRLVVGGPAMAVAPVGAEPATVQIDTAAAQPDLTVFITLFDHDAPGKLHWRMVTAPFPGRPPRLDGVADLGQKPGEEASRLFKQFANLERGQHRESIEGFGEELWRLAPPEFQALYWALSDDRQRPLTIQFVSDDPHLPWELMSPYRDGETHGPIALRHAVARWIGSWAGYMRNRLPKGSLVAIAPHYRSASAQLSQAEAAAQQLVDELHAQRLGGTREKLLQLLEQPPDDPVALVYFTGHGAFAADTAGASLIKLEEDASLSAREVARQKVRLGERHGTVVFLNACEVGATASVLGNVGGWADAFLSRRFGAFIAPLWAIDEEDARQVTQELMRAIVTQGQPLGAALRDLRARHGAVSPTFYSYLLYGDVTARLGTA